MNCHSCWWADFDPENPVLHAIYMQEDHFATVKAGEEPPLIRAVVKCGAGRMVSGEHGRFDHDCDKHLDFEDGKAAQMQEDQVFRDAWETATSRKQIGNSANFLQQLEVMQEDSREVFELLCDCLGALGEDVSRFLLDLNDMNMRGEQIIIALAGCDGSITGLYDAARARSKNLVAYVNEHYDRSEYEVAVERGAHRYGHEIA